MPRHRTHSLEFKRQVAHDYVAGETLHSLAKRHDLSRNLIHGFDFRRIYVEAGTDDHLLDAPDDEEVFAVVADKIAGDEPTVLDRRCCKLRRAGGTHRKAAHAAQLRTIAYPAELQTCS